MTNHHFPRFIRLFLFPKMIWTSHVAMSERPNGVSALAAIA